ncbi:MULTISPECIES: hypothetical protein [unclassified Variovorax]|jgi:hypothetical protein|uniref:hypothetical protein n=1 Tax=unclassified Variovorax TaxID=663243 RepID=UPI000F7E3A2F|nr:MULTISPECIES: hypothetical protein [unclassified Variovorax]RSZ31141.1 hypothetical protein EJO70_31575 [Variovorax sp. 553]RSZ31554.1 hypothetical protein EJO71_31575 [Variovorax sp. 679]
MSYKLEKITSNDVEKIFSDADETKQSRLRARGGFFFDCSDISWAIDRGRGSYLLRAPTVGARSDYVHFYFHFQSTVYELRVKRFGQKETAKLDQLPPEAIRDEFFDELKAAFLVLQSEYDVPLYALNLDETDGSQQ